jgi:hypothetical protein
MLNRLRQAAYGIIWTSLPEFEAEFCREDPVLKQHVLSKSLIRACKAVLSEQLKKGTSREIIDFRNEILEKNSDCASIAEFCSKKLDDDKHDWIAQAQLDELENITIGLSKVMQEALNCKIVIVPSVHKEVEILISAEQNTVYILNRFNDKKESRHDLLYPRHLHTITCVDPIFVFRNVLSPFVFRSVVVPLFRGFLEIPDDWNQCRQQHEIESHTVFQLRYKYPKNREKLKLSYCEVSSKARKTGDINDKLRIPKAYVTLNQKNPENTIPTYYDLEKDGEDLESSTVEYNLLESGRPRSIQQTAKGFFDNDTFDSKTLPENFYKRVDGDMKTWKVNGADYDQETLLPPRYYVKSSSTGDGGHYIINTGDQAYLKATVVEFGSTLKVEWVIDEPDICAAVFSSDCDFFLNTLAKKFCACFFGEDFFMNKFKAPPIVRLHLIDNLVQKLGIADKKTSSGSNFSDHKFIELHRVLEPAKPIFLCFPNCLPCLCWCVPSPVGFYAMKYIDFSGEERSIPLDEELSKCVVHALTDNRYEYSAKVEIAPLPAPPRIDVVLVPKPAIQDNAAASYIDYYYNEVQSLKEEYYKIVQSLKTINEVQSLKEINFENVLATIYSFTISKLLNYFDGKKKSAFYPPSRNPQNICDTKNTLLLYAHSDDFWKHVKKVELSRDPLDIWSRRVKLLRDKDAERTLPSTRHRL